MLRLISANLRHGSADPGAFAELVRREDAAVVAVQELGPRLAETLSRLLPHGKLEPTPDGMGMGVALRRPAAVERLALPHRDARVARLEPEADIHATAAYRSQLVRVLTERVVASAVQRAGGAA